MSSNRVCSAPLAKILTGAHKRGLSPKFSDTIPEKSGLFGPDPVLPFLVFFGKREGKPPKKQGFFYPRRTPKIPGKEGENAQKKKEILARKKKKQGIPKRQGKEGQGIGSQGKKQGIPKRQGIEGQGKIGPFSGPIGAFWG